MQGTGGGDPGTGLRNRDWGGLAPPNMEILGGHAPPRKIIGGANPIFENLIISSA